MEGPANHSAVYKTPPGREQSTQCHSPEACGSLADDRDRLESSWPNPPTGNQCQLSLVHFDLIPLESVYLDQEL